MRADVHVLDHCGNVADACVLSALAGLLAFRRPDVTVGGGDGIQVWGFISWNDRAPCGLRSFWTCMCSLVLLVQCGVHHWCTVHVCLLR